MLRLIPLRVGHVRITILWLAHINIDKRDFDSEVVLPTKILYHNYFDRN